MWAILTTAPSTFNLTSFALLVLMVTKVPMPNSVTTIPPTLHFPVWAFLVQVLAAVHRPNFLTTT